MVKLLAGGFTKIRPSYKVHHLMWSLIIPIKAQDFGLYLHTYIHTYIYLPKVIYKCICPSLAKITIGKTKRITNINSHGMK